MNIYHLELFYHLVVNEGVSRAARALDKEQPTLSKLINELEDYLGVRLYQRRPFKLTEEGETLFRGIGPFFRELPKLEARVKGGDVIRIGASPIVLMYHLPVVEKEVRKAFPRLHLVLRESNQPQLVEWLERDEIDLAITLLPRDLPQKVFSQPLVQMPLVLVVPKRCRLRSADELWRQAEPRESLICLPPDEIICREFQAALKHRRVEWRPRIEVGSLDLVHHYVEAGYGIGLSLQAPGVRLSPKLRAIALADFPVIPLGMLWRDNADRLAKAFREQVEKRAEQMVPRSSRS